jgi:hypothetical protein
LPKRITGHELEDERLHLNDEYVQVNEQKNVLLVFHRDRSLVSDDNKSCLFCPACHMVSFQCKSLLFSLKEVGTKEGVEVILDSNR